MRIETGLKAGKALGDRVAEITHTTGLDRLANLYTATTGQDCGCQKRRQWLNRAFPG